MLISFSLAPAGPACSAGALWKTPAAAAERRRRSEGLRGSGCDTGVTPVLSASCRPLGYFVLRAKRPLDPSQPRSQPKFFSPQLVKTTVPPAPPLLLDAWLSEARVQSLIDQQWAVKSHSAPRAGAPAHQAASKELSAASQARAT